MRPGEARKYLGIGKSSMDKLVREKRIKYTLTPGGYHVFDSRDLDEYLGQGSCDQDQRTVYAYARVSTKRQKEDLERQADALEAFCIAHGWQYQLITDIGSGMNFKKPGLIKLADALLDKKISRIVVTHKDRLLRFGSELLEQIAAKMDTEILYINQGEERNAEKELADDIITIITVFSGRLYGSGSKKKEQLVELNKQILLEKGEEHESKEDNSDGNSSSSAGAD